MQPKDIFRIIVASLGLYIIYSGIHDLTTSVLYTLNLDEFTSGPLSQQGVYPRFFAARGAIELVIGFLTTNGFIPFTSLAFPENTDDGEVDAQSPASRDTENPHLN